MKYVSAFLLVFGFLAVLAAPAGAAAPEAKAYRIDPAHTRVVFWVSHLGLMKMPGHAHGINGKILFHFRQPESSQVELAIDARQLGMDVAALDQKLQGKEFFNTAKFPVMTFKSTSIDKTGIDTALIHGNFTLLGVTRPVTLETKFNGRKWNKYARAEAAGFSAKATIRRSEFGMKAYLPDIGDDVTLDIEVEAQEIRPESAAAGSGK